MLQWFLREMRHVLGETECISRQMRHVWQETRWEAAPSLKVKVTTRKVHFRVLVVRNFFMLDVFEGIKDSVNMERAALFKKNNYGQVITDVLIASVGNHKRIWGHLVGVFSRLNLVTELSVRGTFYRRVQNLRSWRR